MITYKPIKSKNHNARIVSRVTRNGKFRTETTGRDDKFSVAVSTDPKTNTTRTYIDGVVIKYQFNSDREYIELNGRNVATINRVLAAHEKFIQ